MTTKPFKIPKTAEAGAWLSTPLSDSSNFGTLADHFPEPFAAYARVFHPARKMGGVGKQGVRWQAVAEASDTKAHRLMQWPNISKVDAHATRPIRADAPWMQIPTEGNLPSDVAAILASILHQFTATPESCWFAVWDGHGFDDKPWMQAAPTVNINGQGYRLFTGPVETATESFYDFPDLPYSANMWWPDDHAWLVVTHIDLQSTYIGGSDAAIEAILDESQLETFQAFIDDDDTLGSDLINLAD